MARHRVGTLERFGFHKKEKYNHLPQNKKRIWIHAASVGEVMSTLPMIKKLSEEFHIILSVTTASGYCLAQEKSRAHTLFFYPFDIYWIVRKIFRLYKPDLIILMESEMWPNFLFEAHTQKIPVVLLNGRMSHRSQKRYLKVRFFYKKLFKYLEWMGVQNEELKEFFKNMGYPEEKIHVTGNVKFDMQVPERLKTQPTLNRFVLTAASTHPGEEEVIISLFQKLKTKYPDLFLILAPRHLERLKQVRKLLSQKNLSYLLRSEEDTKDIFNLVADAAHSVLLVDVFGELLDVYACSTLVFVGKSLFPPGGGQNVIEPAVLRKPVFVGACTNNFKEIVEYLLSEKALVQVRDPEEFEVRIEEYLSDYSKREALSERAQKAIYKKQGNVKKNLDIIFKCFESTHLTT